MYGDKEEMKKFYEGWKKQLEEELEKIKEEKRQARLNISKLLWQNDIYERFTLFTEEVKKIDDEIKKTNRNNDENNEKEINSKIKKYNILIEALEKN